MGADDMHQLCRYAVTRIRGYAVTQISGYTDVRPADPATCRTLSTDSPVIDDVIGAEWAPDRHVWSLPRGSGAPWPARSMLGGSSLGLWGHPFDRPRHPRRGPPGA